MAYIVGSASVEIVPDFKNAQLAITRFFNSQKDQIKVPVKLDIDKDGKARVEREAVDVGDRIGKAINAGTAKSDVAAVSQAHRVANAMAEARRKAFDQQARAEAAQRAKNFKDEEAAFQRHIRAQIAYLEQEQKRAAADKKIEIQVEIDKRKAILAGRETGGLIAESIRHEMHQNAFLIAAVLAGILAVGAPAAIGAAVALFGGIGAVAAAQSERVKSAWIGTWQDIRINAISDAQVLVPVLTRAASAIGESFERMRPQLREAFAASAPHIDSFVTSVTQAAENALPGLVRAVVAARPVVEGLGSMLESTGTGLSRFFDSLAAHAPAAGMAAKELGRTFEAMLPALAELLGQGAELASVVLPALTGGFNLAHGMLTQFGSALPAIAAGFLGFRLISGTSRMLKNFAADLGMAALQGGTFAATQGKLAGVASTVARNLPSVGVAAGVVAAIMARSEQQANDWASALAEGGAAADKARSQMGDFGTAMKTANTGVGGFLAGLVGFPATFYNTANAVDSANKEFDEYIKNLTPLEVAQRNTAIATKALEDVLGDENSTSRELIDAKRAVADAAKEEARVQEELQRATEGVTEAMVAQGEAARGLADASFGYENAVNDMEDALEDYNKALAEGNEEEKSRALLALQESWNDMGNAARDVAEQALPAMLNEQQKSILADKAQLDELNRLHDAYGDLGPILENQRTMLAASTSGANESMLAQAQLAESLAQVGIAVESIPGSRAIKISADDAPIVRGALEELGFTITELPDGSVRVEAETEEAKANLGQVDELLAALGITVATPTIDATMEPFRAIYDTVVADLGWLGVQRPTPKVDMDPTLFHSIKAGVIADVGFLQKMRPRPTVDADPNPFLTHYQNVMARTDQLNRTYARPTVGINDQATGPLISIQNRLGQLYDRTVTVTTRNVMVAGSNIRSTVGPAEGGAIENGLIAPWRKYDIGGAVIGPGGPREDRIPAYGPEGAVNYRISNGEHILDARDVALMGGQAGVYAFREMLNTRALGSPGPDTAIRAMVSSGATPTAVLEQTSTAPARQVNLYTPDTREALRQLKAMEHEEAVLASPWRGR